MVRVCQEMSWLPAKGIASTSRSFFLFVAPPDCLLQPPERRTEGPHFRRGPIETSGWNTTLPFTFSHPAAAVPLRRWIRHPHALSAVVVGSIMPDLHLVLFGLVEREATHSLAGLLWFCLPGGLLVLALFHHLLKAPMAVVLPDPVRSRLERSMQPARSGGPAGLAILGLAVVGGAVTHLALDTLTSPHPAVLATWPGIREPLFTVLGVHFRPNVVFQLTFSSAGLLFLAMWGWTWYRSQGVGRLTEARRERNGADARRVHLLRLFWGIAPLVWGLFMGVALAAEKPTFKRMVATGVHEGFTHYVTALCVALVVGAFFWQGTTKTRRREGAQRENQG